MTPSTNTFNPRKRHSFLGSAIALLAGAAVLLSGTPTTAQYINDPGDQPASTSVTSTSSTASYTSRPAFGAQYRGNWGYTEAQRIELLNKLDYAGVKWLRIGIPWSSVQPRKPSAGDSGFSSGAVARVDRLINEADSRGFQVSVTFGSTPKWANGGKGNIFLPTDPQSYVRAVQWMASRYRGKVQSWQIYNEPNLDKKLNTTPVAYTRLLCATYPALHRSVDDITVVSGGTAGNDWEWVKQAYAAGAKGCFDVLATHPYQAESRPPSYPAPDNNRWWFQNIELVRDVMLRYNDAATPVWFTEIGWSTHAGIVRKPGVTLQQQADYLEEVVKFTNSHYPYVQRLSWYMARNETHSDAHHNNFGLYYLNLDPKPAALRLRRILVG